MPVNSDEEGMKQESNSLLYVSNMVAFQITCHIVCKNLNFKNEKWKKAKSEWSPLLHKVTKGYEFAISTWSCAV